MVLSTPGFLVGFPPSGRSPSFPWGFRSLHFHWCRRWRGPRRWLPLTCIFTEQAGVFVRDTHIFQPIFENLQNLRHLFPFAFLNRDIQKVLYFWHHNTFLANGLRFVEPFIRQYFRIIFAQGLQNLDLFIWDIILDFKHCIEQSLTKLWLVILIKETLLQLRYEIGFG